MKHKCIKIIMLVPRYYILKLSTKPESGNDSDTDNVLIMPVPLDIKPLLAKHRIEVLFWGVRNLQKIDLVRIHKPSIVIECVDQILESDYLSESLTNLNFTNPTRSSGIVLSRPQQLKEQFSLKIYIVFDRCYRVKWSTRHRYRYECMTVDFLD